MSQVFTTDSLLERFKNQNIPIETVVDIGASDGKWSVACRKHLPNTSILAIDPLIEHEQSLNQLKQNFDRFDYCIAAAGASGEEVSLNVTADLDGSTINGENEGVSRKVQTIALDDIIDERSFSGPFFLKFDTHGYEIPILDGAREVLKKTSAIFMEMHNFQLTRNSLRFAQMCIHMENLGFRVADIAQPMLRKHDSLFWQLDVLLLKNDNPLFSYPHYA